MNRYYVSTSQFNGIDLPCVRDENDDIVAAGCTTEDATLFAAAPKVLNALKGAREAIRKALPFLPADSEAVFCGEWLDEINQTINEAENKA